MSTTAIPHRILFVSTLFSVGLFLAPAAFADPATGWLQTAAGTYDYNNPDNWVGGDINGIFGSDLTLAGAQTITFGADTTLAGGLSIGFAGGYKITFTSDGASSPVVTLGGDIAVTTSAKSSGATFGSSTAASNFTLNFGGAVRTVSSTSGNAAIVLYAALDNGGLVLANAGEVNVPVANVYAGGTWLHGNGLVKFATDAFGTGPVHFGTETTTAKINTSGNDVNFTHSNHLFLDGNINFENAQNKAFNLGTGNITIARPLTFTVAKNTVTLGGQLAADSPYGFDSITKSGSATLATPAFAILGDFELCATAGIWQLKGEVSGTGRLIKTGGGGLEFSRAATFTDTLVIREGTVRFRVANALAAGTKILIEENGVLRSNTAQECNYMYSVPRILSSGIIDPASTGTLALSSNESGDMDLTDYPNLKIGANGNNFNYTGAITVADGRPYYLGGGGKTLTLVSENALSGDHDVILSGSVAFSAFNNVSGTISLPRGYTLTVGNSASLPNARVEADGSVQFNAGTAGSFVRLHDLLLRSSTLTLATPSAGAVTHIVSGTLSVGANPKGGTSRIVGDNATANPVTLRIGALGQADPSFLYVTCTPLADPDTGVTITVDTPPAALASTGTDGTPTAPVIPWVRIGTDGRLAKYGANGIAPLDAATEQAAYADGYEGPATPAQNLLLEGAVTNTFTSGASLNSIAAFSTASGSEPALVFGGETLPLLSGAIATRSEGALSIAAPIDFGSNTGYISFRSGKNAYLHGNIAGSGGIVFSDGNPTVSMNQGTGFHIQAADYTFTGDVIIQNQILIDGNAHFLPSGTERPGNLYLYAPLYGKGMTINMNGLYGTGTISTPGSAGNVITIGCDGSDGDFSGTIGDSGVNLTIYKVGAGHQRLSGPVQAKYTSEIRGGTLQVDNLYYVDRSESVISVLSGATLAGCGTVKTYNRRVIINNGATLAPGSKQIPNQAMTIDTELQIADGGALRFHVGSDRVSQVIVTKAVTGTTGTVPVTIEGEPPPNHSWLLMEATSFNPSFKLVPGTTGKLRVETTETTQQLWYDCPPAVTLVILK